MLVCVCVCARAAAADAVTNAEGAGGELVCVVRCGALLSLYACCYLRRASHVCSDAEMRSLQRYYSVYLLY